MIKIQFLLPTLINNTSQSRMFEMSYSYLYLPFSVDFSCSLSVLFIIDSPKTLPSRIFQKCFSCSPFKHTSQFLYTQPRGILPVLFLRVSVWRQWPPPTPRTLPRVGHTPVQSTILLCSCKNYYVDCAHVQIFLQIKIFGEQHCNE